MNEFADAAEHHGRELLLHCYRMLGSLPDAEDAVQETLLRAWQYRDSLKEGAPLRPWLYRVVSLCSVATAAFKLCDCDLAVISQSDSVAECQPVHGLVAHDEVEADGQSRRPALNL